MQKLIVGFALAAAGLLTVAAATIFAIVIGPLVGAASTVIVDYFWPYVGAKAMALTGTHSPWEAGIVLGFFSGFIKASLTTTKKD